MKKIEKVFWYLFGFFVVYVLVGFKLISYVLETQIIKNIEENLNAKASITRLEFNPFIFKVKINKFKLYDENKTYVSFDKLILDANLIENIKTQTILVNDVVLKKLILNVAQNKDEFDVLKIVKSKNQEQQTTENEKQNLDIKFLLASFKLENSSINFIKDKNYKMNISNINNHLSNLGNTKDIATNSLSFNIDKNSKIITSTTIKNSEFKDFEIISNLDIKSLDLKKLSDYKKEILNDININSILLDSKININFKTKDNNLVVDTKNTKVYQINLAKADEITFKAKELLIDSSNFDMKNNKLKVNMITLNNSNLTQKDDIKFSAKSLLVKNTNFDLNKNILDIKNINLNSSNFTKAKDIKFKGDELIVENTNFDIKNSSFKVGDIDLNNSDISYIHFKAPTTDNKKENTQKPKKEDSSFAISTNEIKINNSKLNFEDRTLKVPFKVNINKLNGFVSSLNTKENLVSDLKVDGIINKYSTAKINAKVNLNDVKILSDIDFKIKNLNIKDFTPYSREFIAQDLDDGKLDVNLKYNIQNSNLDAKNNVIINNIKLGKTYEIKGVKTLPLGIAIALLEDSNGVIEINLPVAGNLDDPEFSVAPIVWKAFTNLIFKAITAPFSLLGAIFNFSDDEINKVTFEFNNTLISPIQKEPLDKLVKILTNRPNMALEFSNIYNSEMEKNKIIEEKYNNFIKTKNKKISLNEFLLNNYKKINGEEKTKRLLKDYKKKQKELGEFLIKFTKENIKVSKKDFEEIAILRGENIKEYLIKNGVKEKQIIIKKDIIQESLQRELIIIKFKVDTL